MPQPLLQDNDLMRVPPQALDLEEAVLGALLLEKDAFTQVADFLQPDVFYKESHRIIFNAIRDVWNRQDPVDILTVTQELKKSNKLDQAGGAYALSRLTHAVASSANIEYHARILAQKYIQRRLIGMSTQIIKESYDQTTDVFELLDKAEKAFYEITQGNLKTDYQRIDTVIDKSRKRLEELSKLEEGLTGVPSGIKALDKVTSGWQNSDLVIVAARPGMGKTSLVMNIARNAAVDHQKPVAIFSLEMSAMQLVMRLISSESEIPSDKLRQGKLQDFEWKQLSDKVANLYEAPIFLDDTPALSIFELRAKCRRLKHQHDISLVVVDYLQLMTAGGENRNRNREQEVGQISRALKALAKELDVPVIALSQLSRQMETRSSSSKRPQLSDLRESGSIEQDADMVIFIYRPEKHEILEFEDQTPTKGLAELVIAKHRNGPTDNVRVRFIEHLTRFTDIGEDWYRDSSGGPVILPSRMNAGEGEDDDFTPLF